MRLPWNRKYMEISFYVTLTVLIIGGVGVFLFRLPDAKNVISETAGDLLAVFAPVLWALLFSLLLEPMVSFFQKQYEKHCSMIHRSHIRNRKAGTILAYLSAALLLFFLATFLADMIGDTDLYGIAFQISDYIRRMGDILVLLNLKLAETGLLSNVEGILSLWTEQAIQWFEAKVMGLANRIPILGSSLLDILIGLAAAFYFLMEKQKILSVCRGFSMVFLGGRVTACLRRLFYEIYTVFAGYLSGQVTDAAIMSVLFSAAFLIVGLPQAIFLGILSGFFNLIPYFGAVTAFILAVFTGLLSGTPIKALYASVLILLLQQADSIFIVPRVVGKRIELHPVLVLFSLAVFGRLFGFWGLLVAVPLGALCKNLIFWLYERKRN